MLKINDMYNTFKTVLRSSIENIESEIDKHIEGNVLFVDGLEIEFSDKRGLFTAFLEIFVSQDYYFNVEEKHPAILDCGSNIGLSVLFLSRLYPDANIIAFEPNAAMKSLLDRNIIRNNIKNVTTYPHAVFDKEAELTFYQSETKSLAGSVTKRRVMDGDDIIEYKVASVKLSDYITDKVAFLKLDIEGVEGLVIKEIEHKLKYVRYLFCEFHEGPGINDNSLAEILTILERNGFQYKIEQSFRKKYMSFRNFSKFDGRNTFTIWACNENFDITSS